MSTMKYGLKHVWMIENMNQPVSYTCLYDVYMHENSKKSKVYATHIIYLHELTKTFKIQTYSLVSSKLEF
jgi:hypothetical protein